jgi:hypothetical protein
MMSANKQPAKENKRPPILWIFVGIAVVCIIIVVVIIQRIENPHNNNGYNTNFENNFMSSCKSSGSSVNDCTCIYKALKQNYTYTQAQYFDNNPQSAATKLALDKIVDACKK